MRVALSTLCTDCLVACNNRLQLKVETLEAGIERDVKNAALRLSVVDSEALTKEKAEVDVKQLRGIVHERNVYRGLLNECLLAFNYMTNSRIGEGKGKSSYELASKIEAAFTANDVVVSDGLSQPLDRAVKTFVIDRAVKTFAIKEEMYAATAELTEICNEFVRSFLQADDVTGTWYYFNRLLVNENIRGRGLATKLMSRVIFWADTEDVNILNELNPYGGLNMDQLISFYKKFGFEQPNNNIPLMTRVA